MTIKIIGAGFGRTGTLSLKTALEELGFNKCYHMIELFQNPEKVKFWENASQGKPVDWDALFEGYSAIVDFPGCDYYLQLMQHYPDAKVILTIRDPETWYESTLNSIYQAQPPAIAKFLMALKSLFYSRERYLLRLFRLINHDVWQRDFQGKFEDKNLAIDIFKQHIEEVKRVVPPEKLLVFQVKQGWEPLCNFLGVPIPVDKPFPRLNDRISFNQRSKQLRK
jgi:Sulfotransferase domain